MLYSILDVTKLDSIVAEPLVSDFFSRSRLHDINSLTFYRKTDVDIATQLKFNVFQHFTLFYELFLTTSFLLLRGNTLWLSLSSRPPSVSQECFLEPQVYGDFLIDVDRLNLWSQFAAVQVRIAR